MNKECDSIRRRYASIAKRLILNHPDQDYCFKLVCVSFKGSRFVNVGFNKPKTDSYMRKTKRMYNVDKMYSTSDSNWTSDCIHAEVDCIKGNTTANTVVVARMTNGGQMALAKPCLICENALRHEGIKTVWYSTGQGFKKMTL